MHRKMHSAPAIFVFTLLLFLITFPMGTASGAAPAINCQAHEGTCTLPLGDQAVILEITPRPVTAMQDSLFTVTIKGPQPAKAPYLDLGMPAMKMGPNRVLLKPDGKGSYTGKGVIVRCKSGRRTWFAEVVVPEAGKVQFVFDVVY